MGREYPSPRKALLGNDHVANLYCGVKYVFWQTMYLFLAIGLLVGKAVKASGFPRAADRIVDAVTADRTVKWLGNAMLGGFIIVALAAIASFYWVIHAEPYIGAYFIDAITAVGIGLYVEGRTHVLLRLGDFLFEDVPNAVGGALKRTGSALGARADTAATKTTTAAKTVAEKTPKSVRQRVYGYCPVSFDIEPKWFEAMKETIRR
jgi:hypothetical protein